MGREQIVPLFKVAPYFYKLKCLTRLYCFFFLPLCTQSIVSHNNGKRLPWIYAFCFALIPFLLELRSETDTYLEESELQSWGKLEPNSSSCPQNMI